MVLMALIKNEQLGMERRNKAVSPVLQKPLFVISRLLDRYFRRSGQNLVHLEKRLPFDFFENILNFQVTFNYFSLSCQCC